MAQNLAHFIFNSDYPMDKVVFYKQVEVTVPARQNYAIVEPHNLLFTPLPLAVWATSADFSDTRSLEPVPDTIGMDTVKADAANITVTIDNGKNTSVKAYVRLYGLLPETAINEAAPTARQSSKLIFDTDKVYSPLIFSGLITSDLNSTHVAKVNVTNGYRELVTQANRIEIEHNLGDCPYMLYWRENNNIIEERSMPDFLYGYPLQQYDYSDTKKCGFYCGQSDGQDKWHIRIYANV